MLNMREIRLVKKEDWGHYSKFLLNSSRNVDHIQWNVPKERKKNDRKEKEKERKWK